MKITEMFKPFATITDKTITLNITKKHPENFQYALNTFSAMEVISRAVIPDEFTEKDCKNTEKILIKWEIGKPTATIEAKTKNGKTVKGILSSVELQALTMKTITCPKCKAEIKPEDFKDPGIEGDYKCPKCGYRFDEFVEIEFFRDNVLTAPRREK